jgi:hypothetical protein
MSIFGNLLKRQYETVASIKVLTLRQVLNIPRDKISTTKIIDDDDFKTLPTAFQDAVKYIKIRKRADKEGMLEYKNIESQFMHDYKLKHAVSKFVDQTAVENSIEKQKKEYDSDQTDKKLEDFEKRIKALSLGGKKRTRKPRKQRRRKTRRSV